MFEKRLKVYYKEADSFRDLFKNREEVRSIFQKQEKQLLAQKDKFYRSKERDVTKWGGKDPVEMEKKKMEMIADKAFAYKMMMVKETQSLFELE